MMWKVEEDDLTEKRMNTKRHKWDMVGMEMKTKNEGRKDKRTEDSVR
jgi:hypothetical protein